MVSVGVFHGTSRTVGWYFHVDRLLHSAFLSVQHLSKEEYITGGGKLLVNHQVQRIRSQSRQLTTNNFPLIPVPQFHVRPRRTNCPCNFERKSDPLDNPRPVPFKCSVYDTACIMSCFILTFWWRAESGLSQAQNQPTSPVFRSDSFV